MKSLKKVLIILIALSIFISIMLWASSKIPCVEYEKYKALNLRGSVIKKFIDPNDHSYPIINIQNKDGLQRLNLFNDTVVYNSIDLGDTIKKAKDDPYLYVKNGQKNIKAILQFACDTAAK